MPALGEAQYQLLQWLEAEEVMRIDEEAFKHFEEKSREELGFSPPRSPGKKFKNV